MLSGFQEMISLCCLEIFEQAEFFWRVFAWKCFPWRRRKCPPPLWWAEEGGLVPDWFWWRRWEEKWVVLFPIYLLHCHCTSTFTSCIKKTENSRLLFLQMFILWAFKIQILEIGNLRNNTEDVGWSRATLHWCMDFGSAVLWQQQKWKLTWEKKSYLRDMTEFSPQRISPLSWWLQTQSIWDWQLLWITGDVIKASR